MNKRKWTIVAVIAGILLVVGGLAAVFGQGVLLRITGVRPFVDDWRVVSWVNRGADSQEIDATLKKVYDMKGEGPGSWVYELAKVASQHEQTAVKTEAAGDQNTAFKEYQKAVVYYYMARFPFISSSAKQAAYDKHVECYLKLAKSFDPPLEVVRIPFEGKEIIGYMRVPHVQKPPVVLLSAGSDAWKSDVDYIIEPMLAQGLATFAMDLPGTGQSAWAAAPDSDKVYRRVLEYLKTRSDIDGQNMGFLGLSFGGHYAVQLALSEPMVKAAVNVGGPVAISYTIENMRKENPTVISTTAHAMQIDPRGKTLEEITRLSEPLSLDKLLSNPSYRASLLSIDGDQDNVVPIEDLYIISKKGIQQDVLVYKGDQHCAPLNAKDWTEKAAAWLKSKLTSNPASSRSADSGLAVGPLYNIEPVLKIY
ncbi:MAG: alpha/beta fold hydrolase [Dehalococcoidia bacterium]|jgi:dienelactone hydrolase